MNLGGKLTLLENSTTATGSTMLWPGGKGRVFAEGTFPAGSSGKLQVKSPNGTWIDHPTATFTAAGVAEIELPACEIRGVFNETVEAGVPILDITNANPAQVTLDSDPGYVNGDLVLLTGLITTMTEMNNRYFTVQNYAGGVFELAGEDSTAYGVYVDAGVSYRVFRVSAGYMYAVSVPR